MLEWMYPQWFLALPLALLPLWGWWQPHTLRFSSVQAIQAPRSVRSLFTWLPPLLETLALGMLVIALARPTVVHRETQRESQGIDIMLSVDTSGSMEQPDMGARGREISRLDAAKLVMANFVKDRPDDRIGLVLFGQEAFVQVPLTLDHDALADLLGQVEIGMAGKNATAVGDAIAIAAKRMKELKAPSKVLILVTDGRSNAGSVEPLEAAKAAAALGIRVYPIGVGSTGGRGLMGIFGGGGADVDEPTLRQIASLTSGKYYRATDAAALAQVYSDIDTLEKSTAKVKEYVHRDEMYLNWLLPALGLYVLQLLLAQTWQRRLP